MKFRDVPRSLQVALIAWMLVAGIFIVIPSFGRECHLEGYYPSAEVCHGGNGLSPTLAIMIWFVGGIVVVGIWLLANDERSDE